MRVHVSDHALLRYMERRFGIDVDGFRQLLIAEAGDILDTGARAAVVNGLVFVVNPSGNILTTVKPARSDIGRTRANHRRLSRECQR